MTLIEILVVISIILAVTAAALPILSSATSGRQQREAARLVAGFLNGARARALEIGRPVGVRIEPFEPLYKLGDTKLQLGQRPEFAVVLTYIETPPPYSGETLDAVCSIVRSGQVTANGLMECRVDFPPDTFTPAMVALGDELRINYQGLTFTVIGPDALDRNGAPQPDGIVDSSPIFVRSRPGSTYFPWTNQASRPLPYQFYRSPAKTAAQPLRLPQGAVVDLRYSGLGPGTFRQILNNGSPSPARRSDYPIEILFQPDGSVARFAFGDIPPNSQTQSSRVPDPFLPSDPIYLLIGKTEGLPDPTQNVAPNGWESNWKDYENLWISINPHSGLVTTSGVAQIAPANMDVEGAGIVESRAAAKAAQQIGGR